MATKEIVAFNINRLIEKFDSSQSDLARGIGLEVQTVHLYVAGKRFPKPENMDSICEFFKVPLTELFKEKESGYLTLEESLKGLADNLGYEIKKK